MKMSHPGWLVMLMVAALLTSAPGARSLPKSGEPQTQPSQQGSRGEKKDLPLEPVRKLEFTTEEATWLSLDISPDGRTIVFELLGDLYSLPIAGGKATRITEGMAYDSQPRFSPDGKWIAFISDRDGADNLWIARPDGSEPRKLSRETRSPVLSPAWTPDSQYVVVTKIERGYQFWLYHIQGGSGINLTASREAGPPAPGGPGATGPQRLGPVFSPDGRYLYFAQKPGGASVYNQMSFEWQIARRDMKEGEVDILTRAQGGAIRPVLSPDGRQLVYGTRHEARTGLRIRDLESGKDRWLLYPVQRDDMESRATRDLLPGYAFTPDGRELILSFDGKIHRVNVATGATTPIPFTAEVSLGLGPLLRFPRRVETGPVRARLLQDPVQSPDGKRLAFSAMTKLYVMDLPNGTPRRLTSADANEFKPAWSPDGRWIAYVTWDYTGEGHIWKVRSDGSAPPERLTRTPAFYTDVVFSPDGERIVARQGNAWMRMQTPSEFGGLRIPLDIVWLPASGGEVQMVIPARGLSTPHFASDPERIYLYSREGLISLRYDGTDRRAHLRITGRPLPGATEPPPATDAVISPDGRWALARVNNQIFVMPIPVVGGTAPTVNVFSGSVPVKQLTDIGADSYGWADGGRTITWTVGSTFFRRPFSSIRFEPPRPDEKSEEKQQNPARTRDASVSEANLQDQSVAQQAQPNEEKKPKEAEPGVESFAVVLEFPRHVPKGTLVLRGATVITMRGDEVIPNADLVVTDNRITAIGRRGSVPIPSSAKVVDLRGRYIVPGFVDTHAHYEMRTAGVLEPYNWSFLANLAYGVTTGLDVQTSTNDYLTYQDLVEAGMMLGPRAYSTGPGVFSSNDFQSFDQAKFVLEKYKKYYRNHNLKSYTVGNRRQRQWVVQAARELGLTVTTEGALDLKLDMTHAMDGFGGNEHALPIVPLYQDVVRLFAESKTAYTPTLLVLYGGPWAENYFYQTTEVHDDPKLARFYPHNELDNLTKRRPWFRKDEHSFPQTAAQAAKIQRAGGLVGVGAHGQLQGLGYHWEMWALAAGGMTPREVLRAATRDGATIIGLEQDLGSIEPGKLADLIVLRKNPLEDIRNTNTIEYVLLNGELFEGDTLRQIYPVERELPPLWWWQGRPKPRPDAEPVVTLP